MSKAVDIREDGTLTVTVDDATKIGRVLVQDDKHNGWLFYADKPKQEDWQELKETIIELRDNEGTGTQQEVCKFLANLMNIIEKGGAE